MSEIQCSWNVMRTLILQLVCCVAPLMIGYSRNIQRSACAGSSQKMPKKCSSRYTMDLNEHTKRCFTFCLSIHHWAWRKCFPARIKRWLFRVIFASIPINSWRLVWWRMKKWVLLSVDEATAVRIVDLLLVLEDGPFEFLLNKTVRKFCADWWKYNCF